MPVFRLDPTIEQLGSHNWQGSTIGAQACWVQAENENAARWAVTMATAIALCGDETDDSPQLPWPHAQYATCVVDPSKEGVVGPGYVLDAGGHTHAVPPSLVASPVAAAKRFSPHQ